METATTAFLVTLAIVGALSAPLIFFYILGLFGNALKALGQYLENKAEEIKKLPPYDDAAVNLNPATRVMTVRFYRKGRVIYQGSVTQNDLRDKEESDPIRFSKDAQ